MLDPFTALSIASAVVQFVDYGTGLVKKTLEIYGSSTGTSEEIVKLQEMLDRFRSLAHNLETSTKLSPYDRTSPDEKSTIVLAQSCQDLAARFLKCLDELRIQGQPGYVDSMRIARKIGRKKKEIAAYQKQLDELRAALSAQLLSTLCDRQSRVARTLNDIQRHDSLLEVNMTQKMNEIRSMLERLLKQNDAVSATHAQLPAAIASLIDESQRLSAAQRILDSLRYDYMEARRSAVPERYAQTYEWIYEPSWKLMSAKGVKIEFNEWLSDDSGIFWVSGKAGSGKSTLMKFLSGHHRTTQTLEQWAAGYKLVVATHFFWNAGSALQKSQNGLLRALCYEILRQCPNLIPTVCPTRWNVSDGRQGTSEWTQEELNKLIVQLTSHPLESDGHPVRFCFFIDGLDEYDGDHIDVIVTLRQMACTEDIKICASSRPWNVFQHAFGSERDRMLVLQELTRDDIELYAKQKLEQDRRFIAMQDEDERARDLVAEVTNKANGVFLWVSLVVRQLLKSLENADSILDLQRRLRELPPGLEEYFQHMFDTIDDFYRAQTAKMFRMCLESDAAPPLLGFAVLDLQDSLAARMAEAPAFVEDDVALIEDRLKARINGRCRDLLEVVRSTDGFRFVDFLHRTVQDFLTTKDMTNMLNERAGADFDALEMLCTAHLFSLKRFPIRNHTQQLSAVSALFRELMASLRRMELESGRTPFDALSAAHDRLSALIAGEHTYLALGIEQAGSLEPRRTIESDRFTAAAVENGLTLYVKRHLEANSSALRIHTNPSLLCIALGRSQARKDEYGPQADMLRMLLQQGATPDETITLFHRFGERERSKTGIDGVPISVTGWDYFLGCIFSAQQDCTGSTRTQVMLITEAMIEAGAGHVDRCKSDAASGHGEDTILHAVFGASEAQRLSRLRPRGLRLTQSSRRWLTSWWQ